MILLRYLLISFLFISCKSPIIYNYSIETSNPEENIDTRLSINIYADNSNNIEIEIQAFPKRGDLIDSYQIVFDMKFRDDYEGEFNGVCIGPSWDQYGPGEFIMLLDHQSNFKNSINGKISQESDDRCNNYFYYARFLDISMKNGEEYFVGVATDYSQYYPDAPHYWKVNKNNQIDDQGTTNIEKYSLNFELKK